jgi:arylsulfatase A-like enzyme
MDAVRSDHFGCYGYSRQTTPQVDRFAEDAILFENVLSQSSWTRPSMVSVLSGLYPQQHGVNGGPIAVLTSKITSMAELLQEVDYETVGVITNSAVAMGYGMSQGFERWIHLRASDARPTYHAYSDEVNQEILAWLDSRGEHPRPFFLWAHSSDPHDPYTPPEPFRSRFVGSPIPPVARPIDAQQTEQMNLYDGEIAFNDHQFGLLMDGLKQRGLFEDTLIILVSDHGEGFKEHDRLFHGNSLYSELLGIPLVMRLPRADRTQGVRIRSLVQQVDILPTVLDVLGISPSAQVQGTSTLPLLAMEAQEAKPAFSYLDFRGDWAESVTRDGWKLIRSRLSSLSGTASEMNRLELFDLNRDPHEQQDLSRKLPERTSQLVQILDEHKSVMSDQAITGRAVEPSEEVREELKALGYIE